MHSSQNVDVRDILVCDYKLMAQIALRPNKFRKDAAQQVSPCKPLNHDILSLNLYMTVLSSVPLYP